MTAMPGAAAARAPELIAEERDPARLAIALQHAVSSLVSFLERGAPVWGGEVADPAKRRALFTEIALAGALLERILVLTELVASYALSREEVHEIEKSLGIVRRLVSRADELSTRGQRAATVSAVVRGIAI